jgi:hypothetical protein
VSWLCGPLLLADLPIVVQRVGPRGSLSISFANPTATFHLVRNIRADVLAAVGRTHWPLLRSGWSANAMVMLVVPSLPAILLMGYPARCPVRWLEQFSAMSAARNDLHADVTDKSAVFENVEHVLSPVRSQDAREGCTVVVIHPQAQQVLTNDCLRDRVSVAEAVAPRHHRISVEEFSMDRPINAGV